MERELKIIKILMYIMATLKIIKRLEMVNIFFQMVIYMKENLIMLLLMEKEKLNLKMGKFMKEILKKGKLKEKVN